MCCYLLSNRHRAEPVVRLTNEKKQGCNWGLWCRDTYRSMPLKYYFLLPNPTTTLHSHCTDCFMMTGLAGVLDCLRPRFSPSHSESGLTLISLIHIPSFHLCEMLWRKHTNLVLSYTRWPESPDENSHDKKLTQIWDKPRLYLGMLFEVSHCTSALHGNPHIPCPPRVEYQMIY